MTSQEKAEAYMRSKYPELVRDVRYLSPGEAQYETPQLHHWLRPIYVSLDTRADYIHFSETVMKVYWDDDLEINFSLITGQPDTLADYKAYCDIVGITSEDKKDV